MRWPRSGTPDSQADCFVKVVPAVAVSEPRTVAPPKTDKKRSPAQLTSTPRPTDENARGAADNAVLLSATPVTPTCCSRSRTRSASHRTTRTPSPSAWLRRGFLVLSRQPVHSHIASSSAWWPRLSPRDRAACDRRVCLAEACILGHSGDAAVSLALESLEASNELEDAFVAKALRSGAGQQGYREARVSVVLAGNSPCRLCNACACDES
jgi:hypothetical protein